MKLVYDPGHNIAYLRWHERTAQVETLHLSDEINVDIAPDGTVYGIELLNANQQLGSEDQGIGLLSTRPAATDTKSPSEDGRTREANLRSQSGCAASLAQ